MKRQSWIISILLAVLLLALTGAGIPGKEPPPENTPFGVNEVAAVMDDIVPIQGRLTDNSGKTLTGNFSIRFRIYDAATAGTILCDDTDIVAVENGLFNANMDFCTGSDLNGNQLWLGVKVGSDPEMTPRKGIYAVPYAWSLRPVARSCISRTGIPMVGDCVHMQERPPVQIMVLSARPVRRMAMAAIFITQHMVMVLMVKDGLVFMVLVPARVFAVKAIAVMAYMVTAQMVLVQEALPTTPAIIMVFTRRTISTL